MRRVLIITVIIAVLLCIQFYYYSKGNNSTNPEYTIFLENIPQKEDTNFLYENFNDTLAHFTYKNYKTIFDEVKFDLEAYTEVKYKDERSLGLFGIATLKKHESDKYQSGAERELLKSKDSAFLKPEIERILKFKNKFIKQDEYYLSFGKFEIIPECIGFSKFYTNRNKSFKQYFALDSIKGNQNFGKIKSKEISYRYSPTDKKIYFPITKKEHLVYTVLFWIFAFGFLVLSMTLFFYLPAKVLLNISKGKSFCEENIAYLKFIYKGIMILVVGNFIISKIIRIIILNKTDNIFAGPNFIEDVYSMIGTLIYCTIPYLIYKAFHKGNQLQDEQDLTV